MRTRIKICGIKRVEDIRLAVSLGVDAVGLNFYPRSSRYIDPTRAREIVALTPALVEIIGVFVDASLGHIRRVVSASGVGSIQLHGEEPASLIAELAPLRVVVARRWKGPESAATIDRFLAACERRDRLPTALLLDTHRAGTPGGTGAAWDWAQAAQARWPVPLIIAGGLNAENVSEAIRILRPHGVDVAGGVEAGPGIKDPIKLKSFVDAVASADHS